MSIPERIEVEPALTAEEWRAIATTLYVSTEPLVASIARANWWLADSDPRKITREWIHVLRDEAEYTDPRLDAIADALASYLPEEAVVYNCPADTCFDAPSSAEC